ncbi:hypothetical protein Taro_027911 [Colocasia esculenta]|uniref:Uncharacterized protein n=1 Tax=Colocasia esculenta TaxID=4460 RepID=A0A843VSR3_COLES|nr:hypothetical protein [Colocasia esculenta]
MPDPSKWFWNHVEVPHYLGEPDQLRELYKRLHAAVPTVFPFYLRDLSTLPPGELPLTDARGWGSQSQVRKRERNYTVVGLGYTAGPENSCKPRHHKNPAVTVTTCLMDKPSSAEHRAKRLE